MGRRLESIGFGTLAVDIIRLVDSLPKDEFHEWGVNYMLGKHRYPSSIMDALKLFKRVWPKKSS